MRGRLMAEISWSKATESHVSFCHARAQRRQGSAVYASPTGTTSYTRPTSLTFTLSHHVCPYCNCCVYPETCRTYPSICRLSRLYAVQAAGGVSACPRRHTRQTTSGCLSACYAPPARVTPRRGTTRLIRGYRNVVVGLRWGTPTARRQSPGTSAGIGRQRRTELIIWHWWCGGGSRKDTPPERPGRRPSCPGDFGNLVDESRCRHP